MASIVEYVRNCSETFEERALTRVDSLVLSWLSYLRIPEEVEAARTPQGLRLTELATSVNTVALTATVHDPNTTENLLLACALSPRFSQLIVCNAVDNWSRRDERQFSATTYLMPGGGVFIAMRGTDNTIIGWKESLNMAFLDTIPAQLAAREYVESIAAAVEGPIVLGGHSKGGNLAAYAAATANDAVRERITTCFVHDAPGFSDSVLKEIEGALAAAPIDRTIPQGSFVGQLLGGHASEACIVQSTTDGLLQHSPFTWVVEGNDFATASAVSYDAYRASKRVNTWIKSQTAESRERFIEILFKLVQATGEVTVTGLTDSLSNGSLDLMLRRLDGLADDDRAFFLEALEDLVATLLLGPAPANPTTPAEKVDAAADKIDDITAKFNDRLSKWDKYLS